MEKKSKTFAIKTRDMWANQAAQALRGQGVDLERPTAELNRRIDAAVAARVYHESQDHPKMHLDFEYPMRLFLEAGGGARNDVFEAGLPSSVRVSKLYVPFADGSALLVQTPNEDAILAAKYIKMFVDSAPLRELMEVDAKRLASLRQIVDVGQLAGRVAALDASQIQDMINAEAGAGAKGAQGPLVHINMASSPATVYQAVGALLEFFERPSDTITASTSQWLTREFGAKAA